MDDDSDLSDFKLSDDPSRSDSAGDSNDDAPTRLGLPCWNIDVHHNMSKSLKEAVTSFLTSKNMSRWHTLYMDNFYNSVHGYGGGQQTHMHCWLQQAYVRCGWAGSDDFVLPQAKVGGHADMIDSVLALWCVTSSVLVCLKRKFL